MPDLRSDRYHPNYSAEYGCYWHASDREGEENSVGGEGSRPVSNSVMYAEAVALNAIATELGNASAAAAFAAQADVWQSVVLDKLWSEELQFFVTLTVPKPTNGVASPNGVGRADLASDGAGAGAGLTASAGGAAASTPPPSAPGAQCPSKGAPTWPTGKQVTVREIMGLSSPWGLVLRRGAAERLV